MAHVKDNINRKNNFICENTCFIKCVFNIFSCYKWVVNMCP